MTRKDATQSRNLRAALWYAKHGYPVFPLQAGGKRPLTPRGFKNATTDPKQIVQWWTDYPDANIGIPTGEASGIVVVDIDRDHGGEESWEKLRAGRKIPKTAKQETGRGRHIAFRSPGPGRCGKLAKGIDHKADGGYIVVEPSVHPNGKRYRWKGGVKALLKLRAAPEWLLSEIDARNHRHSAHTKIQQAVCLEGERNEALTSLAGTMRRRGMSQKAIEAGLLAENRQRCCPPLSDEEVSSIAASVSRYKPGDPPRFQRGTGTQVPWPAPLASDAFHGVAGEFVRLTEPHTEADPAALLLQFLVAAGNLVGRNAHFHAEADLHYSNLFTVIVGLTSKGRKGTSLGHIKRIMSEVDAYWVQARVMGGLSTGEGLIAALKDKGGQKKSTGNSGRPRSKSSQAIGNSVDKRLLVVEPEFARVLQVAERPSNIISAVIRQAWDDGTLRILTKKDPVCATNAHVSLIAHVTKPELRRCMTATSIANGFANRMLWTCALRSKTLPDGGQIEDVNFAGVFQKLRVAAQFASTTRELRRDAKANALWRQVYEKLSEGKPGLLGAATSRAEAQVMRLACVYAVLDCSKLIRVRHLKAALEVWRYCEDSARYIFGEALGDPTADEILRRLRESEEGLSRDQLRELFSHNKSSEEIDRALAVLEEYGLANMRKERSGGRGRPVERWHAMSGVREKRSKAV